MNKYKFLWWNAFTPSIWHYPPVFQISILISVVLLNLFVIERTRSAMASQNNQGKQSNPTNKPNFWTFVWRMHFNCSAWRQAWPWKQPFQEKRVPLFVAESFCAPIFKWVSLTPKEMKIYTCFKSLNTAKEWMLGWMQKKMIGIVFCYVFLLFSFPPVWKVINTYGFWLTQTTNADKENVRSWS